MATRNIMMCDVYGTTADIAPVKLKIERGGYDDTQVLVEKTIDLSPKAQTRLLKAITNALKPTAAAAPAERVPTARPFAVAVGAETQAVLASVGTERAAHADSASSAARTAFPKRVVLLRVHESYEAAIISATSLGNSTVTVADGSGLKIHVTCSMVPSMN